MTFLLRERKTYRQWQRPLQRRRKNDNEKDKAYDNDNEKPKDDKDKKGKNGKKDNGIDKVCGNNFVKSYFWSCSAKWLK